MKRILAALALMLFATVPAQAANIRNIDLGRRAEVWFAEDHTVPVVSFNISLPASKLDADDYILTLRGFTPSGELEDVSQSLFRVEKK